MPAAGGDELAADARAADPGVGEDLAGDLVGHGVDAQRRAGVGVGVGAEPSGDTIARRSNCSRRAM